MRQGDKGWHRTHRGEIEVVMMSLVHRFVVRVSVPFTAREVCRRPSHGDDVGICDGNDVRKYSGVFNHCDDP